MQKQHITLNEADFTYLQKLIGQGTLAAKTYKRAFALLELNRGKTFRSIAESIDVSEQTVSRWAKKYTTNRLAFLTDKPRSGRPVKIDAVDRAKVTALACSQPPEGYSRWTLRLLAEKLVELEEIDEISFSEVGRTLKKMNFSLTEKDNG